MNKWIFAFFTLVFANGVLAQTFTQPMPQPNYNQHGNEYFLEGGLGPNLYYAGLFTSTGEAQYEGLQGFGWYGSLGYMFTPTFGTEVGFMQNYGSFKDGSSSTPDRYKRLHVDNPYLSMRFNVPINCRFNFIAKLGLMYTFLQGAGGVVLPFTGVGFSYAASRNFDIGLQYQGAVYGIASAGLFATTLTWHFA